jgi:hypothetical protein
VEKPSGGGCSEPSQRWPISPDVRQRRQAESLYETEILLREQGIMDFVYDEKRDLFCFKDGRFAFSRIYANWRVLEERGYQA